MTNGSLNKCYYPICHLSKLINDKSLARKTVYDNFSKLREKGFLKCDLVSYGKRANDKGFKNLIFSENPIHEQKQKKEYFKEDIHSEDFIPPVEELLKFI